MKNKQRALVLAVLFITAIFIVNSYADPGTANTIVGFAGVPTTEFSGAKELGAATVQVNTLSASELEFALETAKSLGLGLVGRAESRRQFQTEAYNIDFVKLKNITADVFSETEIASDPNFLGYYIIDEPCHADKWNITPADFRQFYDTVKEVDPDIKIMVNFGYLGCLEDFVIDGEEEGKIVDIATFVITPKKLRQSPDYIANEAATAKKVKEACPDLQILPVIAVYEYPARDESLPSADWVRQTGLKVLEYDVFDGLVYYPWRPSPYMGDTIEDIADDPDYTSAFSAVFDVALEKNNETANCQDEYVLGPGDYDFYIPHDDLTRLYKVHVPPGYDINNSTPVIIAFHGGGGNAENSVDYFRLNEKSDIEGFIVVHPEGTGPLVKGEVFGTWNAGRCCPPAMDNNVDDVGFIECMLEELEKDFNIDGNSIYATGMSNGAQMCYRLACELANKIAAIAPCGSIGTFDNCTPSRPVPVMHFHGLEDPCCFYDGGQCGTCMAEFLNALGIPVTPRPWDCIPVLAYVDKWRIQNGCSNQTKITLQNGNATCITYQECQDNAEVTICTITGMGHTWPGSTEYSAEACKTRPNGYVCLLWKEAVGALSNDIIANDAMWEFFKEHTLNCGNGVCSNGICEPGENRSICPEDCKEFANVYLTTRIPVKTDAQIDFVNGHYDSVMTSILNAELREKIQGPKLFLYRSIQGTWTQFNQFNWTHIDGNENMFCHNSTAENTHPNNRILTIWNSWLMDGADLVDSDDPDALNHWINYYAVTASEQVYNLGYDGLFIDSASHKLWPGAVYGLMPDGYSDEGWRDGRYAALEFIKSYFPDKLVVFNGLHSDNGVEHSLKLTDGGVWETFAFKASDDCYAGEEKWREAIELVERNKGDKLNLLVSKKKNLAADVQSRLFILTSYLLVSNQNVFLNMIDLDYDQLESIYYYPEYELDLGVPLDRYRVNDEGIYERKFEKGMVLVNPSDTESYTYSLDRKYNKLIPVGGGVLQEDGTCDGYLSYESVNDVLTLPPVSGVVLLDAVGAVCGNGICEEGETVESCPDDCKIELGIAFGDDFNDELFMPYIRDLSADVSLIKLRWWYIEPYPQNHTKYVFNTTKLDNFLAQLQDGDTVLINVFTASYWATNQTCENNTQSKGCPLKDDATCEHAYRAFIYNLVTHANNYLTANNIDAEIRYWQRDTEPASARHFPGDNPDAYVDLQRYFYESVKSADPDAKVVGVCANGALTENIDAYGNIVPNNATFFRYVIANASEYYDLLDIRFYQDVYTIPQRLGWFIREMENNGYRKPVITTEGGGPTSMEFKEHYGTVLSWCGSHGYTEKTQLYDCLYDMDRQGVLPEAIAIFMPYDPRNPTSVHREEKVERMLCRDITQRTLMLLEQNITKHWRWDLRAKKLNFCADGSIDVYGSLCFNKLALLRYPGIICNECSPETDPAKRNTSYGCYQRMQEKLDNIKTVERIAAGNPDLFFYKINKLDGSYNFAIWEKRDIFHGEENPPNRTSIEVGFEAVKLTDVFGAKELKYTTNGILALNITDTPVYIEEATKNPPRITDCVPSPPVYDTMFNSRTFNITINQPVNVSWQINGSVVQTGGFC